MYQIINNHIPGLPQTPYRAGIGAYVGVVAHATASYAPDENELSYFNNNWKKVKAFAHAFVDWDSIREFADPNYTAWGAGPKANPLYLHVELCQTKNKAQFTESYKRFVWTIAYYLFERKLGVIDGKTLVSHDWVSHNLGGSTHTDPIDYLAENGKKWADLVADVTVAYKAMSAPIQPQKEKEAEVDMTEAVKQILRSCGQITENIAEGKPFEAQINWLIKNFEIHKKEGGK